MQKNSPEIIYNHMQEDNAENTKINTSGIITKNKVALVFMAEELLIALLLSLIFYMI